MNNTIMRLACAALALTQAAHAAPFQDAASKPPPTAGAHSAVLTLGTALARALAANSTYRAAALEVEAQEGAAAQARLLPNPELEFVKEGTRGLDRTTTVQLTVPVELGGKRVARIQAARAGQTVATEALAALRAALLADVTEAFYAVAIAAERARLSQDLTQLAERAADAAGRRVQAGKVSPVEETRAKVALAGVRIEAVQANRELESSKARLAGFWAGSAADIGAVQSPGAPGPAPALAELIAQTDSAPSVRRQNAEVGLRDAAALVERSKRMPTIGVVVGTQRDYRDRDRQAVVGLSVPLPLFDRNQGAVLESLRRVDKAKEELRGEVTRVRTQVTEAHARLTAALAEIVLINEQILPGAASAYEAAGKGFEAGKFSFLEVLDAQRTLFQSRIQYLNASAEAWRARTDIERLIGVQPGPLPGSAATTEKQ